MSTVMHSTYVDYLHLTCVLTQYETPMQCCGCLCQYVVLLQRDYWNMKVIQVGPAFLL